MKSVVWRSLPVLAAFLAIGGLTAPAHADDVSRIVKVQKVSAQEQTVTVYAASMKQSFPITVLLPKDASKPRPVFYLLNGGGGGEQVPTQVGVRGSSWADFTTYKDFFRNKNVYVVTPTGGKYSYYTDWQRPDPKLGILKWQTFLTKELPPLLNQHYSTSGFNAVGGLSMSGTSVFNLAIAKPHLYRSVVALSGCARTSDPVGIEYVRLTIGDKPENHRAYNMWGPVGGPGWIANDPYIQAPRLRGTKIYMTSSTGLPGPHDTVEGQSLKGAGLAGLGNQVVSGGAIELAVDVCTQQMAQRLGSLGIPYRFDLRPTGTHSWTYWQDALYNIWPSLARDLHTT